MPNTTAITDLRDETLAAISDLTKRIEQARARMQKLALDTMTEHDARGVAAEATELGTLFALRSQRLNLLAARHLRHRADSAGKSHTVNIRYGF